MASDDLTRRLAALGKPVTIDYPSDDGDVHPPIVAAVNAARETGMASLLYDCGSNRLTRADVMRLLETDPNICVLRGALAVLSLSDGELEAVMNVVPFTDRRTQALVRIDVVCTDHPSQRNRKPAPLTKDEQMEETGNRG